MTSSENDGMDAQHVDEHVTIKKKLNDAFSSHFSGVNSVDHTGSSSRDDSGDIHKIVSEYVEAKDHSPIFASHQEVEFSTSDHDTISNNDIELTKDESVLISDKHDFDPDIFSEAFGKVEYQSVDLDMVGDKSQPNVQDSSSYYSQIVSEVLKRNPGSSGHTLSSKAHSPVQKSINLLSIWDDEPGGESVTDDCSPCLSFENDADPKKLDVTEVVNEETEVSELSSNSSGTGSKDNSYIGSLEKLKQNVSTKNSVTLSKKPSDTLYMSDSTGTIKSSIRSDTIPNKKIAFLYNEKHLKHESGPLCIKTPECPERFIKAMWYLQKSAVFDNDACSLIGDFDAVDDSYLLRVHDDSYVNFIDSYSKAGGGFLGDSTYIVSESYNVAKLSAGAAVKAGSLVADGHYSYTFALTRPPGHHASKNKYGGFCLFNNAAILAKYLQKEKNIGKIMIIDWDAHAGDGTMDIFYDDPNVLFVSLHRDPHGFYPRKGFCEETGIDAGKGYTVNVEMPPGAGDEEYVFAFDEIVMPLIDKYSPEFIICSCGFDAHYKEKNIGLNMTSEGYYQMSLRIASKFPNNFVLLMEGGYHDFNGQLCHSVLSALMGKPNPVQDSPQVSSFKLDLQKNIFEQTRVKVAELKKMIPMLS